MSATDLAVVEYTVDSLEGAPDEVRRLIEADKQPKKVRIRVMEDESLEAFDRFEDKWFPVDQFYVNKETNGRHLSSRAKSSSKVYRHALASDTGRATRSRTIKSKLPPLEITEYDTPEEIQAKREAHEAALAAIAAPTVKSPTKAALEAENVAQAARLTEQDALIKQLQESLAAAEAAKPSRQRRNRS